KTGARASLDSGQARHHSESGHDEDIAPSDKSPPTNPSSILALQSSRVSSSLSSLDWSVSPFKSLPSLLPTTSLASSPNPLVFKSEMLDSNSSTESPAWTSSVSSVHLSKDATTSTTSQLNAIASDHLEPTQAVWFWQQPHTFAQVSTLPSSLSSSNPFELLFNDHSRSEEHTSELQSRFDLVCRLLLEKKKTSNI